MLPCAPTTNVFSISAVLLAPVTIEYIDAELRSEVACALCSASAISAQSCFWCANTMCTGGNILKLRPDALRELINTLPVRAMSASQVVMPTSARSSCLPMRRSRMSLRSKNSCTSFSQEYKCRHCCSCINTFRAVAASFALSQYTNLPFASIRFCAKLNAKSSSGATDRKSTRLNSSHRNTSRMPSSA